MVGTTSASAAAASWVLGAPRVANAATPVGVRANVTRTVTVTVTNCTPSAASQSQVSWWFSQVEGGPAKVATLKGTFQGDDTFLYKGSFTDHPADLANFMAAPYPTHVRLVRGGVTVQRSAPAIKLLRCWAQRVRQGDR